MGDNKSSRVLYIYQQLQLGEYLNKTHLSERFKVSEKSIRRDVDEVRNFFQDSGHFLDHDPVKYSRSKDGYYLDNDSIALKKEDILAYIKIILNSRSLYQSSVKHMVSSLTAHMTEDTRKTINASIANELFNYSSVNEDTDLMAKIWTLSQHIRMKNRLELVYDKPNGDRVRRNVAPLSVSYSEYYFYLIAQYKTYPDPTVLRVDRIVEINELDEKYHIPEAQRFQEGVFKSKIQFMQSGKLVKARFVFRGESLKIVQDRMPTVQVIETLDDGWLLETPVYLKGIVMWFLSQGRKIEVLSPPELVEAMEDELRQTLEIYERREERG